MYIISITSGQTIMNETGFDHQAFKQGQRDDWDGVSSGWEKWWPVLEQGAQVISDALLEMIQAAPGQRIMDIATGIGEPAITAARRVGTQGRVIATDQAPQMLAIARRRAAELGLDNIDFLEMDGELVDCDHSDLDAVVCRWGLMFFPDPARAVNRFYRLLAPGGRCAVAVWSTPPRVPGISFAMGFVRNYLQLPPPATDLPNPFCLADTARLEELFKQAGFEDIRLQTHKVVFAADSADHYTRFTRDIAAPVVSLVEQLDIDEQQAVWDAMTSAVQRYATGDGRIEMENEAICISGRR